MNELDQHPWVRQEYVAAYRERLSSGLVQHLLAVPLNGKSGTFGVLRLLNKLRTPTTLEPSGFDNWDETYLTTVGASVASAIEYAQLLHANKTRLAEISRFYRIYAASAQGNQKNAFQVIVDEALQALPDAHKCEIRLVDDESRTFVSYAVSRRAGIPDHGEPPLHVMEGIAGRALREHTIQVVHDVGQDADFVARGVTIRSLIVAPLFGEMGPVGTLSIDSDRSNVFTHEHEKLISALATHASLALDMTWR